MRMRQPGRGRTARTRAGGGEALGISALVAACVLSTVAGRAVAAGNGRLALWTGVPALGCCAVAAFLPMGERVEHDETGRGEVAGLSFEQFERLVEHVECSAAPEPAKPRDDGDRFERLVRDALDDLPEWLQARLDGNVVVLVSDDGAEHNHYGLYHGGTVANGGCCHTITIYRDTLLRDFGHDPDELRRQAATTVRHELAHHLGAGERHVADLGL